MLDRIKKAIGIEGARLDIQNISEFPSEDNNILFQLRISSYRKTRLDDISVKLIEVYQRGKKRDLRVDEYVLGTWEYGDPLPLDKGEEYAIDVKLPYKLKYSEIDQYANRNLVFSGFMKLAKWVKGVKSEFYLEVRCTESGAKLHPTARVLLNDTDQ